MYVIYHSSDLFAEVTGVSMLSLFENNKHIDEIHVLYIERGVSEHNKNLLRSIAAQYGRTLEFMAMPNWSEKLNINLKSSKAAWLGFGYNRLFLTEFVPQQVDKVLYLDSDTIIEDKLDDLWNIDLGNYYMAAVDDCLSSHYRKIVDLPGNGTYCNSGVLLINLKKWREEHITKKFIRVLFENNGYFIYNEQSLLNSLFAGKILILPQRFNVNSLVYLFKFEELMRLRQPYRYSYSKAELLEAKEHPAITHFTGNFYIRRRPWFKDSDHPHKDAYLKYRQLSPWNQTPFMPDKRSIKTKMYTELCHVLPRGIMIVLVSILYNRIRPIFFMMEIREKRDTGSK